MSHSYAQPSFPAEQSASQAKNSQACGYNTRSPAVKRLLREAKELREDDSDDYCAEPLEDNIFEWHFVIRGPMDSEYEGGRYHGRILLPPEYPFKPPNIMLTTPNGRFVPNKKICLSITGYHPEYWLPAWGIRTVILALIGFMTTKANGAIGGDDSYSPEDRKLLAKRSRYDKCKICNVPNIELLPDRTRNDKAPARETLDREKIVMYYEDAFKAMSNNNTITDVASSEETSGQSAEETPDQLAEATPDQVVEETPDQVVEETTDQLLEETPMPANTSHKPRDIVFIDILIGIVLAIVMTLIVKKFM
ncbi:3486_t:CDS:2 [Paraglomus occultum]|uniref:3486_t:CDS:1 n=1 Tax=Paraglomus occultum TaxID=144539 RepID=A0A9N8WR18_9GLOM|nr:3486_t:CDS:2 [Paraglomus occultum]